MSKMVMSAISEEVKWRDDREQIVRCADERLALEHPKVREIIKQMKDENRQLKHQLYDERVLFERLVNIASVRFWNIREFKQLLRQYHRGTDLPTERPEATDE